MNFIFEWSTRQRLVLSSWSKSFSRNPEKIFRAVVVQLLLKLTFIRKRVELNLLKLTHWKFVFYLHLIQLQTSNFNSYNQDVLVKLTKIAVLVVVVILFRRHASAKFQEAISVLKPEPRNFRALLISQGCCFWPSSLRYNVPVNQNKLIMSSFFIKFAHDTDVWNSLSSACTSMFHPVKHDWNHFNETTYHLQQFRTDNFSTFFKSEAFILRSPRLVKLN